MELYNNYPKKKSNFPKYLLIIVLTVALTLFTDRTIEKANEIDDFAEKLDLEEEKEIEMKEEIVVNSEDYIENVLNSTVGISLIKPTGNNIFDGIRKGIYSNKSTLGAKKRSKINSNIKFR